MRVSRLLAILVSFLPAAAVADDEADDALLAQAVGAPAAKPVVRTWLFNEDAQLPAFAQGVVFSRLTWSSQASAANRPFAASLGSPGAMVEVGGELGLGGSFSLQAIGMQGAAYETNTAATGGQLGFRWAALARRTTRVVLGGGRLRDFSGGDGAWANVAFEQDVGRGRLALSVRGDHGFGQGRDGMDFMVTAGAHMQLSELVHAGVEYVAQDLEGLVEDDAEGGASHLVGAVVGVRLLRDQLSVVGGPALGLGRSAARALGRVAIALAF
jgi:hypothetical protein